MKKGIKTGKGAGSGTKYDVPKIAVPKTGKKYSQKAALKTKGC